MKLLLLSSFITLCSSLISFLDFVSISFCDNILGFKSESTIVFNLKINMFTLIRFHIASGQSLFIDVNMELFEFGILLLL